MTTKEQLSGIMSLAWQFIKNNGYTKAEALKTAWLNFKLKAALKVAAVVFTYRKQDGSTRRAIGTTHWPYTPKETSDKVQIYFDIEKMAWRSFNKWNLLSVD